MIDTRRRPARTLAGAFAAALTLLAVSCIPAAAADPPGGVDGMGWPHWWSWELQLSSHVKKRMIDRGFTEIDLRRMLEHASGYRRDFVHGRWVIETRYQARAWHVIVEPDDSSRQLTVITAFPAGTPQ